VITHANLDNYVLLVDVIPSILDQTHRTALQAAGLVNGVMMASVPLSRSRPILAGVVAMAQHAVQDLFVSTIDARRSTLAQTQRLAALPTKAAVQVTGVSMVPVSPLFSEPRSSPVKGLANALLALHAVEDSVVKSPSLPTPTIAVKVLLRIARLVNFVFLGNANP
jgi:hypothetical protein